MKVEITDVLIRHISFEEFTSDEKLGDVYQAACNNVPVELWKEYCALTNTFTIEGDNKDELEEKTFDIQQFVFFNVHACSILADGTKRGFDVSEMQRGYGQYVSTQVAYGQKNRYGGFNGYVASVFPDNYLVVDDSELAEEIGEPLVYFYMNKEDVMEGEEGTEEELQKRWSFLVEEEYSDYPLNSYVIPLGVTEENAYGEVYQLPLSIAQQYCKIELD